MRKFVVPVVALVGLASLVAAQMSGSDGSAPSTPKSATAVHDTAGGDVIGLEVVINIPESMADSIGPIEVYARVAGADSAPVLVSSVVPFGPSTQMDGQRTLFVTVPDGLVETLSDPNAPVQIEARTAPVGVNLQNLDKALGVESARVITDQSS